MVVYALRITAETLNIKYFRPKLGVDNKDFVYVFQVSCASCVDDVPRRFSINLESRKSNYKCRICRTRGCYIKMIPGYGRAFKQEDSDNHTPVTLMHFECYGVIPLEFSFNGKWDLFTKEDIMEEVDFQNGSVVKSYHDNTGRAATIVNWDSTFDQI